MDIVGDRRFLEIAGDISYELPPLLVRAAPPAKRLQKAVGTAADIVEAEELIASSAADDWAPEGVRDRRKMDLALQLVQQYKAFVAHWRWGDSILEWIRQCEITFGARRELSNLLRTDLWPHAARSSFVTLLSDKSVRPAGATLEEAVGLRLAFRQPPPLACCSNQLLFYLNQSVATTAYNTWAHLSPPPVTCLPPERFRFDVVTM